MVLAFDIYTAAEFLPMEAPPLSAEPFPEGWLCHLGKGGHYGFSFLFSLALSFLSLIL